MRIYKKAEKSYYNFDTEEIFVENGENWQSDLYHEYRHYTQHIFLRKNICLLPILLLLTKGRLLCGIFMALHFILLIMGYYKLALYITNTFLILLFTFRYIIEVDASFFSLKRLKEKKIGGQNESEYYSLIWYSLSFCVGIFLTVFAPIFIFNGDN